MRIRSRAERDASRMSKFPFDQVFNDIALFEERRIMEFIVMQCTGSLLDQVSVTYSPLAELEQTDSLSHVPALWLNGLWLVQHPAGVFSCLDGQVNLVD